MLSVFLDTTTKSDQVSPYTLKCKYSHTSLFSVTHQSISWQITMAAGKLPQHTDHKHPEVVQDQMRSNSSSVFFVQPRVSPNLMCPKKLKCKAVGAILIQTRKSLKMVTQDPMEKQLLPQVGALYLGSHSAQPLHKKTVILAICISKYKYTFTSG